MAWVFVALLLGVCIGWLTFSRGRARWRDALIWIVAGLAIASPVLWSVPSIGATALGTLIALFYFIGCPLGWFWREGAVVARSPAARLAPSYVFRGRPLERVRWRLVAQRAVQSMQGAGVRVGSGVHTSAPATSGAGNVRTQTSTQATDVRPSTEDAPRADDWPLAFASSSPPAPVDKTPASTAAQSTASAKAPHLDAGTSPSASSSDRSAAAQRNVVSTPDSTSASPSAGGAATDGPPSASGLARRPQDEASQPAKPTPGQVPASSPGGPIAARRAATPSPARQPDIAAPPSRTTPAGASVEGAAPHDNPVGSSTASGGSVAATKASAPPPAGQSSSGATNASSAAQPPATSQTSTSASGAAPEASPLTAATGAAPTPPSPPPAAAVPDQHRHPGVRPPGFVTAREDKPDDLQIIRGIGPQNEERLHKLGVWHFDQISAWTADEVHWVGSYLAFPGRIDREKWVEQARDIAAGAIIPKAAGRRPARPR